MADAKPNVKGGKPLPKWALPVGAVVVVAGVLYYKKSHAAKESTPEPSTGEQLNRQSFIPVTGENVAGVGASGGGVGSGGGGEGSNNQFVEEILKTQREESTERERNQREGQERLLNVISEKLGTGGGAPTTQAPPGTVAAPPQGGATPPPTSAPAPPVAPPAPAPTPPKPSGCPPSYPYQGPHGCFKNITCGNGCGGHRYQNGQAECQTRGSHGCAW